MINEKIYSKLTPSAQEALDKMVSEYRDSLLEKAFLLAQERETASKEISLRDILETNQLKHSGIGIEKSENRKKRMISLLALSGAVYSVLGILIYLFQNKKFAVETDLGLIIAITGIIISLISFLYGQLISKRYSFTQTTTATSIYSQSNDYDIVKRWQIIETLAKKFMTEADQKEAKNNSVGFLIRFLSHKVAKDEKEFLKIRELLQMRNKILHKQYNMSDNERKEFLELADDLIERLESSKIESNPQEKTLKVNNAKYGSPKNSFDMTKELNQLINNNRLEFVLNNEIVGDPDPGVIKTLEISYEINGERQTRTYNEGAKVVIQ
ncbi:MAG: hypothetical protein AAB347_09720 [Bacteroidota bacterium]